jgi:polyhydroxybutyrate depolymerase
MVALTGAPGTVVSGAPAAAAVVDERAPRTAVCSAAVLVDCTRRVVFPVGALTRTAYVYLPPAAATRSVPMVVVAHGLRQSPRIIDDASGWTTLARQEGFAVTLPLGYWTKPEKYGYQASWNAGTCCGPASERWDDIDDMKTMDATVKMAKTVYPSDGRVYFAGFSNGAMLGFRLHCEGRGPFRAIVAVHGTVTMPSCRPAAARPFLAIHARQDTVVPYVGCTSRQQGTSCQRTLNADLVSGRAVLYALRAASGCTGTSARRYAAHTMIATSSGCVRPGPVHMIIDNAGHGWVTDKARYGINETEEAWQFLRTK